MVKQQRLLGVIALVVIVAVSLVLKAVKIHLGFWWVPASLTFFMFMIYLPALSAWVHRNQNGSSTHSPNS
ncbi:MAG: hypothetical protein WCI47_02585 [bacterium]